MSGSDKIRANTIPMRRRPALTYRVRMTTLLGKPLSSQEGGSLTHLERQQPPRPKPCSRRPHSCRRSGAATRRQRPPPFPTAIASGQFIPGAPRIVLEPDLALALFVAPALR